MEGINIVQKAVSIKTAIPILEGILIEAEDKLKLTGNNLEMAIEYYVAADIQVKGSIVVDSKMLGNIIGKMPDIGIMLESHDNNTVLIESGDTHFAIKGLSPEGFPAISRICSNNSFTLSQGLIKDMIRKSIFAASTDESMPIITGSLIECRNGQVTFVSMDKTRMAVCRRVIENADNDFNVVVPAKTLNEIAKILQPNNYNVFIETASNQIAFSIGDCKVTSRLLEGKYFNYRSMILSDYESKVTVNTKRLLLSVERAFLITTGEKMQPVKFSVHNETMHVSCTTEFGEVKDEFEADVAGRAMNISFNPALFLDTLRAIEDEKIELLFMTEHGPCTIRPVNSDMFTYVIAGVVR